MFRYQTNKSLTENRNKILISNTCSAPKKTQNKSEKSKKHIVNVKQQQQQCFSVNHKANIFFSWGLELTHTFFSAYRRYTHTYEGEILHTDLRAYFCALWIRYFYLPLSHQGHGFISRLMKGKPFANKN